MNRIYTNLKFGIYGAIKKDEKKLINSFTFSISKQRKQYICWQLVL